MVHLANPPEGVVARLAEIGGDDHLSETMVATANRYLSMIQTFMPSFSNREWGAIFDALRRPWTADPHLVAQIPKEVAFAIDTDRLDNKWGIDGQKLRNRLNRMSYGERMAIGEMTLAFYQRLDRGDTGDVVASTKAMFRPDPAVPLPQHQIRLSPEVLLGADAVDPAPDPADTPAPAQTDVTEAPPRPDTESPPQTDPDTGTETSPAAPPDAPADPPAVPGSPESGITLIPDLSGPEAPDNDTGAGDAATAAHDEEAGTFRDQHAWDQHEGRRGYPHVQSRRHSGRSPGGKRHRRR